MKYADLQCRDCFKINDKAYIVSRTFSGNKISFRIDSKDCGHKCIFMDTTEIEYTTVYEYENPYLSNIGLSCRLDSAPIGQPLYIPDTDEYIVKFTATVAFWISGKQAGKMTVVNVDNPMVKTVNKVYVRYCEEENEI